MKSLNVVFFYEKQAEKTVARELCPAADLIFFPLKQSITRANFQLQQDLVIIYDATRSGKGKNRLQEIRKICPQTPVFLMARNASKEYLRVALDCKVNGFFPFPVDRKAVQLALEKVIRQAALSPGRRLFFWARHILLSMSAYFKQLSTPNKAAGLPASNLQDAFGIAPAGFRKWVGKELEKKDAYDISVQFFGSLSITIRGKKVSQIKGKKNASVLAYLLYNHHRSVHRDILIDKFWSDFSSASAKNSLNVAICSIRKDLAKVLKDQEGILYENESYCINPQLEVTTDVEKFTLMWKKGRAIEEAQGLSSALPAYNKAVALYQKEFLESFRFEEWCEPERANLQEIYLFILNRLSAFFFEQENYYGCINICKKMLSTDKCLEEVYRKLMKCYYALGLTDMAFRQYFKCKKVLKAELDLSPSKPTEELFESMQMGQMI